MTLMDGFWFWLGKQLVDLLLVFLTILGAIALVLWAERGDKKPDRHESESERK